MDSKWRAVELSQGGRAGAISAQPKRWFSVAGAALLAGVIASPTVATAQLGDTDVVLDFQFPPGFSEDNLPAILEDDRQSELTFLNDYIATQTTDPLTILDEIPVEVLEALEEMEEEEAVEAVTKAAARTTGFGIGLDATFSEDVQIFALPLSYRPLPHLKLQTAVPIVRRTGDDGEVVDLGDVSFSAGVRWGSVLKVLGITTAYVKAPTGDPEAKDHDEFLPTGSGSWDVALYQTLIKRFGRWRGELTFGYRFNTEGDIDVDLNFDGQDEDIALENGDVANVIVGVDRGLTMFPGLIGSVKVDIRHIDEADLSINGVDQPTEGDLTVVDLLPGVKYLVAPGTPLRIGLRVPMNHIGDRKPALDIGIYRSF